MKHDGSASNEDWTQNLTAMICESSLIITMEASEVVCLALLF